jgi:3-oxoacyl-[acyl-carrier protein] reductase
MVKGIAIDLAPRGITVNNIQPGPTLTDMTADYIDSITPAIPLKRVGDPDEIAGLFALLGERRVRLHDGLQPDDRRRDGP